MSRSVNRVILLGNCGREVETKFTPSGKAVAKFSLATSERYKDKSGEWTEKTEWTNVVAWERLAEIAGEYIKKGDKVYVEGRLQTRSWEKDGQKHYSTEVNASEIVLLGKPEGKEAAAPQRQEIADEDIPF